MMFLHLKKDLDIDPVDWINCEDPVDASDEARPSFRRGDLTTYGIRKDVQKLLAGVRTDLDSFHEVEAYALMTSGYRMAESEFSEVAANFPVNDEPPADWEFLRIEEPMKRVSGVDAAHRQIMELLAASNSIAFKIWKLSPVLKYIAWFVMIGVIVGVAWASWHWWDYPLLTPGRLGTTAAVAALAAVAGKRLARIIRYKDTPRQIAIGIGMGILGWIVAAIHLLIFDRMYLRRGRLSEIEKREPKPKAQVKSATA
jgi:hypothetical protein